VRRVTTVAFPQPRGLLADRLIARRGVLTDTILIISGTLLTIASAQLTIPMWPVPITGETLAVLLVGATLGAWRAGASMLLYLLVGLAGLPVFADHASGLHTLFGTTGGYLVGFVFAAAFTGWLAQRSWDRKFVRAAVSFLAGSAVVFVIGLPWLAVVTGASFEQTLMWGLVPFIPGGIVKAAIAAIVIPLAWRGVERLDKRR